MGSLSSVERRPQRAESAPMRAIFGVLTLLLALAVVAVLVRQQLRASSPDRPATTGGPAAVGAATGVPGAAEQQKVREDVNRLLQQGAARAASEAE